MAPFPPGTVSVYVVAQAVGAVAAPMRRSAVAAEALTVPPIRRLVVFTI